MVVIATVAGLLACPAAAADAPTAQSIKAELVSPAPSSTLTATTVTFRWTGGVNVGQYWLNVGTAPGLFDLANINAGRQLSAVATNLPSDGSTLYVRLNSHVGGSWQFTDYTLISVTSASPRKAELFSPAPSSTLDATTVLFRWTGGVNVAGYWLNVGTAPGTFDLANVDAGTNLSVVVSSLPTNASVLYVRLHSLVNWVWQYNDYTITAATLRPPHVFPPQTAHGETFIPPPYVVPANILGLSDNLTLSSTTVTFEWTGSQNVTQCQLIVETAPGLSDLWSEDCIGKLSSDVSGLPANGEPILVTLRSLIDGVWQGKSYSLVAVTPDGAPLRPHMISPGWSEDLTARTTRFRWTGGIDASAFVLNVRDPTGNSIPPPTFFNGPVTGLAVDVTGVPSDWGVLDGYLEFNLYGAQYQQRLRLVKPYFPGGTRAELISPAPSSTLNATTARFEWTGGQATNFRLCVGTAPSVCDIADRDVGTALDAVVPGLPSDGRTIYVRLQSLISGGLVSNDYTVTATTAVHRKAELVSPAPMWTLTSSVVEFEWTGGVGPALYRLYVGTLPGGFDLANRDMGTDLRAAVSGLPHDGSTLYVRLFSHLDGSWQYNDYTIQAATMIPKKAQLLTPTPGSTVGSGLNASTVQFRWTRGVGVAEYWLYLGTTLGAFDIVTHQVGYPDLGTTVNAVPTDGRTIYVRLHSLISGVWQYDDYILQTLAPATLAQLISPTPGSTLTSSSVTLEWNPAILNGNEALYWVNVGSTPGALDLFNQAGYDSIAPGGVNRRRSISGLPIDGRTLYVRLFTNLGTWQYVDYVLTAADLANIANLISPAPNSTLSSTSVTFQWSAAVTSGTITTTYWLNVGTGPGLFDLANIDAGTNLGVVVSGLPADGRTLYVRLHTNTGAWAFNDYVLTASGSLIPLFSGIDPTWFDFFLVNFDYCGGE